MPVSTGAELILLDLPVHDSIDLLLDPVVRYDNPVQSVLPIYDFMFGQNKRKMLHLTSSKYNLGPKTNCDTWNPSPRMGLRPEDIIACDFELNGEQCRDEFDAACLRNLRAEGGQDPATANAPALTAIEAAMIATLRQDLSDDIFRIAHFGDPNTQELVNDGIINLSGMSALEQERFIRQQSTCSGWWAELIARTQTQNAAARVAYVDSNDGTVAGNATLPANVTDFLDQLRYSSSQVLKNWQYNRGLNQRAKYLVQSGIFRALKQYYRSLGTELAHQFIINGEAVPGVLEYDGNLVIEMPEWDMYDNETGNIQPNGLSYVQRALFIADGNLSGLINMRELAGFPGSGLIIQASPLLKDKGKRYIYADFALGFGIAQPALVTAAYNSSRNFVTS